MAFVWWQTATSGPLLPPYVFKDPNRAGSILGMILAGAGIFALYPAVGYYLQSICGYDPLMAGLAYLPMVAALVIASTQVSARLLRRAAPRVLILAGMVLTAVGLLLLTGLSVDGSYTTEVLPGTLLAGFGIGLAFVPVFAIATGESPPSTPVVLGAITTAQEVGAAIGGAVLSSVFSSRLSDAASSDTAGADVLGGYTATLWWAAGSVLLAGLVAALMVRDRAPRNGARLPL